MAKKLNKLGVENSLWNNIRANKGSGKAPTKEMLKQERKINAKYEEGGTTDKPRFPGKLETNVNTNPIVNNQMPDKVGVMVNGKPYVKPPTSKDAIREDKKTTLSKIGDFLENPLPSSTGNKSDNMFNMVAGLPGQTLKAAYNTAKNIGKPVDTAKKLGNAAYGILGEAVGDVQTTPIAPGVEAVMDAAFAIPAIKGAGKVVNTIARNKTSVNELINQTASKARSEALRQAKKSNQMAPPPSELHMDASGNLNSVYYDPALDARDFERMRGIRPNPNAEIINLRRFSNIGAQESNAPIKKQMFNKSGLSKEEILARKDLKNKDVVSKMSEKDFNSTVLKPNGEVVPYSEINPGKLENSFPLSSQEYTEQFNSNLDRLNDIIAKNNKSGVNYKVKELNPDGSLVFHTPEQQVMPALSAKQKENIAFFKRDPEGWATQKMDLKQTPEGKWTTSYDGKLFNSKEEVFEEIRTMLKEELAPKKISGETTWGVNIKPGEWKGDVKDIANKEYYRSIPGIEMANTTSGVFADRVARRGTGTYESINEYLKSLDMGRVKPGFNSQTDFSRGLWENAVKSGKAHGYYGNKGTVYGAMKVLPFVGAGALGAGAAAQQKRNGGIIEYPNGGEIQYPGPVKVKNYRDFNYKYGKNYNEKQFFGKQPLSAEQKLDNYLGGPLAKAHVAATDYTHPEEDERDNLRHSLAGRYVAEAIANKTGNIPFISKGLGVLGANVLGVAHELDNIPGDRRDWKTKLRESGEDMYNNFAGSIVGGSPLNKAQKDKVSMHLANKVLPDGYGEIDPFNKGIKKNYTLPNHAKGGRVLPRFGGGGGYDGVRLTGSSTFDSAMKAPAGTVTKTASGKTPSNFGDNVVTGAGIAGAAVPMLTSFIPDDRITDSEGNEVGSKESMGKGILNGAAQGASMGAVAGPWGAAIGAGVGAIYGGVTNSMNNADVDRAQQQANMRIQNRNISNSVLTNKNMFSTNTSNNDQMIAAKGGTVVNEDMGNPNAELELNETFRDPMTGETGMVDGPSHDDGGIEMSLAEGTQIWSDRLKYNGRTFASLTKPIINKIANIEKGLDTNPNSRFKQNSIKLLNAQLDFFFDIQESNKQQDEMKRTLKKQEGGVVDDMGNYHYANGGIYIKPENRGKFTAYKERTGKTTEEALHSPDPHVRQMANFAKNAAGWKHAEGGYVLPKFYEAGTFNDPETEPEVPINGIVNPNYPNMSGGKGFRLGNTEAQNALIGKGMGKDYTPQYGFSQDPQDIQQNNYPGSWKQNPYSFNNINKGVAGQNTYNFDKIGTPTYQEPTAQPENKSQWYRRNNGELIQAGALAGSTFAQLNNINKQAAPGIRPDVRLTGAIPNPRYVDLSAERGAINRSALGAMGNRDFGNSATAQAFKNKARINQLQGLGQSFSNQEIANADIGNKFAGMRGDAAMKEAMMNNEIANTNLENKYQFNQNRMANQNAAIGTLGHGVGDIGRNRTMHANDMEKVGIINNRYDKSAAALAHRDNKELTDQALANGTYTKEDLIRYGIPYKWDKKPEAKYGGTIKTRSLKY